METNLTLPILFFALIFLREIDSNLVLTPSGNYNAESSQTFTASICLSAGSQPKFTLEYVSVSSSNVLYVIQESQNGKQSTGGSCQGTIHKYSYDLAYIDHPSLVGQSVKLRVTTQSPSFSAVSSGVITFTALYSLSGSSTYATLGQDYTWTCDTSGEKPSGVPIMYICWYRGGYQSAQKVGCSAYQSGSCQTEDNDPRYKFGCNSNVFTLTIPGTNVDESEQKSMWRCVNGFRSISTSPTYTSPFKELSLAIPVVNVSLLPSSIASMENVTTTVQCLPNSNAYPQPTITWYKDGVDITNQATTDRKTITLSFTRADKGKILRCTVIGQSTAINASTTIAVIYPPTSDPVIIGYNGTPLQEGDGTITVTCRQEGGNPFANITFVCQGNAGIVITSGNAVTSSHTLTINRSLDKGACTCTTSHFAGNYKRNVTRKFIVYYPPQNPTIQLSASYPWKSGDNRGLTCATSGGNPTVYNFTWTEGATIIHIGHQVNFQSLTPSDNNRQFSCQVDNAYRGGPIRSDLTTLQVECSPLPEGSSSSLRRIVVGQNENLNLTFLFTGGPIPTVDWFYYTNQISNLTSTKADPSLEEVTTIGLGLYKATLRKYMTYDEFGNYVAVLQNTRGRAVVIFQIIRKGKPDPPSDIYADCTVPNQANVSWTPGFNGLGEKETESQKFFILYRRQSDDNFTTHKNEINDTGSRQSGIVGDLSPGPWVFSLMSRNAFGSSSSPLAVPCSILSSSSEGRLHSKPTSQNMKLDTKSDRKDVRRTYEEIGRIEIPEVNYSQLNPTGEVMEYANTTLNESHENN